MIYWEETICFAFGEKFYHKGTKAPRKMVNHFIEISQFARSKEALKSRAAKLFEE